MRGWSIILISVLLTNTDSAFAQPHEICRAIVDYGTYDYSNSFSDKQSFSVARYAACDLKIETYQAARQFAGSGGVDIIDLLGAEGSHDVNEKNYKQLREQFCALDFSAASGSDARIRSFRKASTTIANAFVDCVTQLSGFFGYVTQSRNKEAFSISLQNVSEGDPTFLVNEISAQPAKIQCSQDAHLATPEKPITVVGSRVIACRNMTPKKSFLLAVNTSEGSVRGPGRTGIELAGTEETIADLVERVEKLEGRMVPSGTVAFFATPDCPSQGWKRVASQWEGRYLTTAQGGSPTPNLVGKALNVGENRSTGMHTHGYMDHYTAHNPVNRYEGLRGAEWRRNGNPGFGVTPSTTSPTGEEGTNAPYVALTACVKE